MRNVSTPCAMTSFGRVDLISVLLPKQDNLDTANSNQDLLYCFMSLKDFTHVATNYKAPIEGKSVFW